MPKTIRSPRATVGCGQLTLIEHALCPLDVRSSLQANLVHRAHYRFTDGNKKRCTAEATVFAPLGLSPNDEFYLWGLLALTLRHCFNEGNLRATPHWCLRRLGVIDAGRRRGGRQYRDFAESLRRLSLVHYVCDQFYDPTRREHRKVSFGFLSYSLPEHIDSCRAWRIAWDPIFFELVRATAGHLRFDLTCYRRLDLAARRLFLLLTKIFSRRERTHQMELRDLAVELLGFSSNLSTRDLKIKVSRCIDALVVVGVVREAAIQRSRPGDYRVMMWRGAYFGRNTMATKSNNSDSHPLWDRLVELGFDHASATRLMREYGHSLLAEWVDITQAASERHGAAFFRVSPMAYLVDSVSKAVKGQRTPPDWWHDLQRSERTSPSNNAAASSVMNRIRKELTINEVRTEKGTHRPEDFSTIASILDGTDSEN